MSTEADKTNTAVIATMLALGAAAMLGGSAALVALARGEVQEYSENAAGFADLQSVAKLEAEHRQRLTGAKLPLAKAQAMVLAQIQRDPSSASPAVAAKAPEEGDAGAAGDAGAPQPAEGQPTGESAEGAAGSEEAASEPARPDSPPNPTAPSAAPEPEAHPGQAPEPAATSQD